jgi:hypothetical protein
MMKIELITNPGDWNNYLSQCSFYTFFHTWNWGNILSNSYGYKGLFFVIDDSFIFPCFKVSRLLKHYLISSPLAEYGGPIPFSSSQITLDDMISKLKSLGEQSGCSIQTSFHPFVLKNLSPSEDIFAKYHANLDLSTYMLSLGANYKKYFELLKKEVRYQIRKADVNSLEFEKILETDGLKNNKIDELYRIYLHNSQRNLAIPVSFKFFKYLLGDENCHIYTVRSKEDGFVISAGVFLEYHNVFHLYKNFAYDKFFKLRPVYFMFSEIIKDLYNSDISYLDFGGVRKGGPLEIFKKNWGAEHFDIPRYSDEENAFDIAHLSPFRTLWGKMPLKIIRNFGPLLSRYLL